MICSFPALADANSKILVLGTMPGVQSLQKQQYYAHPQNAFWKILFSLFDELPVPSEFELRKKLLIENGIALWDVLESCHREGSLDSNIKNGIPNKIRELLAAYPNIKAVVFNGKESHRLFVKTFGDSISLPQIVMPSTSPANTMKFETKLESWSVIKKYLDRDSRIKVI
ncbi:DNA-deoxyinosine glycosylase [Flavobacterium sp. MAH-1]|uniref:DNA-deoxyinosine glycosylase n=1 Tax=Flavobacterium agri TaxID=2743471 RepID=A0A7Y8XZK7_9FLAO|nr:DNA-deoxyinosine glycosylase [Flavobacterium agri]NUY79824.1 DNA-deoxyinosine glycosylase [Flavobacterium agri]NYA69849.1 DNA-deoxyinosine glycosylase [Flavobacterium agri]